MIPGGGRILLGLPGRFEVSKGTLVVSEDDCDVVLGGETRVWRKGDREVKVSPTRVFFRFYLEYLSLVLKTQTDTSWVGTMDGIVGTAVNDPDSTWWVDAPHQCTIDQNCPIPTPDPRVWIRSWNINSLPWSPSSPPRSTVLSGVTVDGGLVVSQVKLPDKPFYLPRICL